MYWSRTGWIQKTPFCKCRPHATLKLVIDCLRAHEGFKYLFFFLVYSSYRHVYGVAVTDRYSSQPQQVFTIPNTTMSSGYSTPAKGPEQCKEIIVWNSLPKRTDKPIQDPCMIIYMKCKTSLACFEGASVNVSELVGVVGNLDLVMTCLYWLNVIIVQTLS